MAERELARAVLQQSAELQWDVWSAEVLPSLTCTHVGQFGQPDLLDLKRQFGERVQVRTYDKFQEASVDPRYLFVSNVAMCSRVNDLRAQISAYTMPICALTHSIYTQELLFGYSWLLLSMEPHDVIVASSQAGRKTLENIFFASKDRFADRLGIAQSAIGTPRIVQIPFGTEIPAETELDQKRARALFRIPADAFVVLYFGRFSEQYKADLDPLLQAVHHLHANGHNVWLVLAGQTLDRVYSQHLERRLAALMLADRSICVENSPEFLKSSVYAASDVVVSPSDCIQETFGLSILEAMAHARPVIASSWSGYRELVEDGKTGFLIKTIWVPEAAETASILSTIAPPLSTAHYLAQRTIMDIGELIEKLSLFADRSELSIEMGTAGRKRVESLYAWPHIADQFLALWDEQLKCAQGAKTRKASPVLSSFSHYADTMLAPEDLLARIPGTAVDDLSILEQWKFYDPRAQVEVMRLMETTAGAPVSIGELRHEGFDLDCILWLAKKGLRRIVRVSHE
jgi:glycosyltransferase involved in cell wall biosynthesis